jgi:RNA polymerase subunit RPABC4/transcription elongation factor Spt4
VADALACENCARSEATEADLVPVHRVYLELDEWDEAEPKATVVEEIERWCRSCRSIYPHEVV